MGKVAEFTEVSKLIETLRQTLDKLSEGGYKLYDKENPEFYLDKIYFDKEDVKFKFVMEEENE